MAVKVYSSQVVGLRANIVEVEVDLSQGLHSFSVVGLPDKAVEESKDRISAAIKNSGFISPQKKNQRVTISLAPADLKKEGPVFDLAIALAYLLASKQISFEVEEKVFLGELALNGKIRPIKGTLALIKHAQKKGFKEIFVPRENTKEAALIRGVKIFGCASLSEVVSHLNKKEDFSLEEQPETEISFNELIDEISFDLSDIKGQESAKRGLEIAAAGGHNVLMVGPAGTGKTMLAKAFSAILPPFSFEEVLETTLIHSVAGVLQEDFLSERPFRSPHHTSSYVALVGGGTYPRPGEITLSHRGVLFLDEFPEFERRVIEALRQPLEDGVINISRAKESLTFPARFILICAMNPCPCGNLNSKTKPCVCSQGSLMRYTKKVSGPILDRIDLWLEVPQVEHEKLSEEKTSGESSKKIQERVIRAREIQKKRFGGHNKKIFTNSEMGVRDLKQFALLSENVKNILNQAAKHLDLSGRAYHRVIKLGRTIADLEGAEEIKEPHILEALQYRPK
ncbi:MAG: YifB family Mg chelatase-like AAA ATPase [Candidatus Terrybacteria bacterium]|nr:YifB family Mg chelatase-like AAA ATPase [Candidatus Terrybacteria bacterium]